MEYLTTQEAGQKWGLTAQRVRVLCREHRIPGTVRVGKSYLIPVDAAKPDDPRRLRKLAREGALLPDATPVVNSQELDLLEQCYDDDPDVFYLIEDNTFRLIYANRRFREHSGDGYRGQRCYRLLFDFDQPCPHCPLKLGQGQPHECEYAPLGKVFLLRSRPLIIGGKRFFGVSGTDKTDALQARSQARLKSEQYAQLFDAVPSGLAVFQGTGSARTLVALNEFMRDYANYPSSAVAKEDAQKYGNYVYPDDRAALQTAIELAEKGQGMTTAVFRLWDVRRKEYAWMRATCKAGQGIDDVPCTYLGLTDISAERGMLAKLQESKQELEEATQQSNLHFMDYDAKTGACAINSQAASEYGFASRILADFPSSLFRPDIMYPDDYAEYQRQFNLVKDGTCDEVRFNVHLRDPLRNHYYWRRVHLKRQVDAQGKLTRIAGISQDVDRFLQLEQTYLTALQLHNVITWDYDTSTGTGVHYGGLERQQPFSSKTLLNYELVHPSCQDEARAFEQRVRAGAQEGALDVLYRPEGAAEFRWYRVTASPMADVDSKDAHKFLMTARDVTLERQLEGSNMPEGD